MTPNTAPKNIFIRGFDVPETYSALEHLLRELKPDTCWHLYDQVHYPNRPKLKLPEGVKLIEIEQAPLVYGDFSQFIPQIRPASRDLIDSSMDIEVMTLKMADRMYQFEDIGLYRRRKWHYLDQLAAWNTFIEDNKIDLYLSHNVPHHPIDFVPYSLLRKRGVRTFYFEKLPIADTAFPTEHWEETGSAILRKYKELKEKNENLVTLSPAFEKHFQAQTNTDHAPKYGHIENLMKTLHAKTPLHQKTMAAFQRFLGHSKKLFSPKILRIFPFFLKYFQVNYRYYLAHTPEKETFRLRKYYREHVAAPDWNAKYVYCPLQFQPEASTTPMCGAFSEIQLMIKIIAASIPKDWLIYIKEYRGQTTQGRWIEFYQELLKLPQVRFLDHELSSFELIKNAEVVATGTGTAGWEALFQIKTVLLFGFPSYQFTPGINLIRSVETCKAAIRKHLDGVRPDLNEIRRFLKAAEAVVIPSYNAFVFARDSNLTSDENGKNLARSLLNAIRNGI